MLARSPMAVVVTIDAAPGRWHNRILRRSSVYLPQHSSHDPSLAAGSSYSGRLAVARAFEQGSETMPCRELAR
jgi:hypothetical protein